MVTTPASSEVLVWADVGVRPRGGGHGRLGLPEAAVTGLSDGGGCARRRPLMTTVSVSRYDNKNKNGKNNINDNNDNVKH